MRPRRNVALAIAAICAGALAIVAIAAAGGDGDYKVQAEFTNARGLLPGNEVRVLGAPAGSIEEIELTDRGTALVTMSLHGGLPRPRRDAVAAIRPVDLLGDIYLSLSPGNAREELEGPIPPSRTSNRPRLAELLGTFRAPQRAGLQAMLVELGRALEARGVDLNRAVVELRPAFQATDELMRELGSQNTDLRRLVADAGRAAEQVAGRRRDLEDLVENFAATFDATAANAVALGRGLERAPQTLEQVTTTAGRLERAAGEATPLAAALRDAAPGLTLSLERLDPFLRQATPAIENTLPVLRGLDAVLTSGGPAAADLRAGLDAARRAAPDLAGGTDVLEAAAPGISEGFFQNFPDEAEAAGKGEYPNARDRNYWSGAGVMSCEAFGVPIAPGCMFDTFQDFGLPFPTPQASARARTDSAPARPSAEQQSRIPADRSPQPQAPTQSTPDRLPALPQGPQSALLDFLLGP